MESMGQWDTSNEDKNKFESLAMSSIMRAPSESE